jgi:hypothetical protein
MPELNVSGQLYSVDLEILSGLQASYPSVRFLLL